MKMLWLVLGLSLTSSFATAQDLNFQEYRRFLMQGNSNAGRKMAIQTTCTTAEHQVYRIGEKGYDTCLASLKTSLNAKKDTPAEGHPAGSSSSINIEFGD